MSDGGGLFLLVKPGGGKLWRQKYRLMGKEQLLSHGQYPDVTLAQARTKRDEARAVLAKGNDPGVQKKLDQVTAATQARTTYKLIADEYLEVLADRDLAPATMVKNRWLLIKLTEAIHNRPMSEITPAEMLQLLKRVERTGRRETAKRLRSSLSAVFRYAIVTLRAENDPTWALKDALPPPKTKHRAAITDEKKFGQRLRDMDAFKGYHVTIEAMKFQILTMSRPIEVRGARKQEFDLEARVWTVPGERMKMRREHRVPLSDQALCVVKNNWPEIEDVELLFPSILSKRRWLSENTLNSALRRMGYEKNEATAHGFRSTA
ncbi:MAG: integrase arm-type DNA-binding domain-containing protein, partial [Pseudomonadota bacterium]